MLELAINHEEELMIRLRATWLDDKYKYYHAANYREDMELRRSTWANHDYVSVRSSDPVQQGVVTCTPKTIVGYIGYQIDRASDYAYGLAIINFEEKPSPVFVSDLKQAIKDIFDKYSFRRLEWSVIVGNPVERSYDKLCERYGGRIVGTHQNRQKLIDGRFYDEKFYEIEKADYEQAIKK